jgi:CDP-paratose 2-epimerase
MKVFITGICGFVGSSISAWLRQQDAAIQVLGIDNFLRPGSETNRLRLKSLGIAVRHGDVRNASDFDGLGTIDWVIDAAANPSVLAGLEGGTSTRQLIEHNLQGTINILEYCKRAGAGFILLSTSRVYSIRALASLPMKVHQDAFALDDSRPLPPGVSKKGVSTDFSTEAPISLYGSTKLASEILALEYGETFSLPVWVNRCGVLAGAGQFGTADQGIFSYWIHAYAAKRPLKYLGFDGRGHQVRDAFHPDDLAALAYQQMTRPGEERLRIFNIGGGPDNALSLANLTAWCADRFGPHTVTADTTPRPFDVPWFVTDYSGANEQFGWRPTKTIAAILDEIADHARQNPGWLDVVSGP